MNKKYLGEQQNRFKGCWSRHTSLEQMKAMPESEYAGVLEAIGLVVIAAAAWILTIMAFSI